MARLKAYLTKGLLLLLGGGAFVSCEGVLDGLYDEVEEDVSASEAFLSYSNGTEAGQIYLNCTSYTRWWYINLHTLTVDAVDIVDGIIDPMTEPDEWDIALHRYDVKTNGATVIKTNYTSLNDFMTSKTLPQGEWKADIWTDDEVIIDMSGMMDGVIGYLETYKNEVLSSWMNTDLSTMPPIYTKYDNVFVVKFQDDTYAAIQLENYMNAGSVKGYLTINYIYPLTF